MQSFTVRWLPTILILMTATTFTGCRFGNYSEPPKPNLRETYEKVELFFTRAKSLATYVLLKDNRVLENTSAPLTAIPTSVRNTFTNPTFFAIPSDPKQRPIFVDYTQNYFVETNTKTDVDGNTVIEDTYTSPVQVLWNRDTCLTQIQIAQKGSFDRNETGSFTFADGSVAPVNGRVKLEFAFTRIIDGDCDEDLTRLSYCYTSGAGCSTEELNAANNLYDLYIRQTNVLPSSEAANVRGLVYEVIFE